MRLALGIFFFLSISFPVYPQESVTIYLDKYRFPVEMRDGANSFLVVSADTLPEHFRVNEYFLTNNLKESGAFLDPDLFFRNGLFRTYHSNGKIRSEEMYKINRRVGKAKAWYPNGQLKEIRLYSEDGYAVESFFDSLGNALVTNGNGIYTLDETDELEPKPITIVGPVKDGLKHGTFTGYLSNGTVYCEEEYERDKLVKGVSYSNGKEFTYKELHGKDYFDRFMTHIRKNLRYPASARRFGVDGTVYARLLLNPDYTVKNAMIIKGVSPDIDAETMRVLQDTGYKYGPRLKRGQHDERELLIIPVKFKLN
jgi:hypothetical protein